MSFFNRLRRGARRFFRGASNIGRRIVGGVQQGIGAVRGVVNRLRDIPVVGQFASPVLNTVDQGLNFGQNIANQAERGLNIADQVGGVLGLR